MTTLKSKHILAISMVSLMALAACEGGDQGGGVEGGIQYVKRNQSGFEAIVAKDFTPNQMRKTFGDYCKRYNRVTRALKLERNADGQKVVIGECLRG